MADYPDWVLAHKLKGTYVNKAGDKYYLYADHSERVPGTKKVRAFAMVTLAESLGIKDLSLLKISFPRPYCL